MADEDSGPALDNTVAGRAVALLMANGERIVDDRLGTVIRAARRIGSSRPAATESIAAPGPKTRAPRDRHDDVGDPSRDA